MKSQSKDPDKAPGVEVMLEHVTMQAFEKVGARVLRDFGYPLELNAIEKLLAADREP